MKELSGSVRGYLAEKKFQRGYNTDKSLRSTGLRSVLMVENRALGLLEPECFSCE